jgi:peptidoglycan/LPS O-acetylase OafA/YrhL
MAAMTLPNSSLAYRPELDGIRGLAILGVLIQHANFSTSTVLAGTVGVNVFFVLSGFLITSILMAEHAATGRISLRRFYERRVRRLVPALVATLLVTGVVLAAMGKLASYPGPFMVSLLYVSDIAKAIGYDLGYVGHTWSLAVEEQFYLLWPALIIFLPRRFLLPTVITGIVVAVVLQVVTIAGQGNVLAMFRPDVRMDSILWGCLIALVPVRVPRAVAWLCFAGLLVLSVTFIWPYSLALSSIFGAGLVAGAASMRGLLANRVLVRIGAISYGLYLWQALPHGILESRTLAGDVGASVLMLVISFALALASERWIEMPFRHRRAPAAPAPAPDPAPAPAPGPIEPTPSAIVGRRRHRSGEFEPALPAAPANRRSAVGG